MLKTRWLESQLGADPRILEIGPGPAGLRHAIRARTYTSIDLVGPADIVGCIREWRGLGLAPSSFDVVIAFEVIEHVDCLDACWELLCDGGRLFLTTPVPERDRWLQRLERLGLCQPRTSPHDNLVDLRHVRWRGARTVLRIAGLSQWACLTKRVHAPTASRR